MSVKSLRNLDESNELELQKYLDAVYARLGFRYQRIQDKARQLAGIDLILEFNGREYNIDEKAQIHYVNKGLKTFAFELEFTGKTGILEGWLFDEKKLTTHYFLVCQLESDTDGIDGLTAFRLISVNRKSLIEFLEKKGWGRHYLQVAVPFAMEDRPRYELSKAMPRIRVVRTAHLVERPLNVVINLDDLIEIGVGKELIPGQTGIDKTELARLFESVRLG